MSNDADAGASTISFSAADRKLGVVVGFDGSRNATLALRYAARIAHRRGIVLTVVNSFTVAPAVYTTLASVPRIPTEQLKHEATRQTLGLARELLTDHPGEVTYLAEQGDAAGVLVEKSADAQLLVIGARGLGGFWGLLLGSVASALPAHSKSPTIIVPKNYDDDGEDPARLTPEVPVTAETAKPVVVGMDRSEHSRVAMLHAATAAAERGAGLQLVMVAPPLDGALLWYPELTGRMADTAEQRKAELQQTLDAEADWLTNRFPGLNVTTVVETGDAITLLRKKTRSAQLTVVGTRGLGGFASMVLGSVSRGLLVRAEGPVMVVPKFGDSRL